MKGLWLPQCLLDGESPPAGQWVNSGHCRRSHRFGLGCIPCAAMHMPGKWARHGVSPHARFCFLRRHETSAGHLAATDAYLK